MASRFRVFTRRFFIVINCLVVVLFLLACLAPYLNPKSWWFISVLGYAFPFLLLILLVFLCGWIVLRSKLFLLCLVPLLIGWKSVSVFFAFHANSGFKQQKQKDNVRVLTWNVARFIELKRNNNKGSQARLKMFDLIKKQNADILCLQEFFHSEHPEYYDNLSVMLNRLGYKYFVYSRDNDGYRHYNGSIIFSKFPIIDSGLFRYPHPTLPEALIFADIKLPNDTIRVYTTHLQSFQFRKDDYERMEKIKDPDEGIIDNSKTIFSKVKRGITHRSTQVNMFRQLLKDSPFPRLICADLNDIPNSYTYFSIRGDMQDAFLKKGFGIGRTFRAISPTLRIDYILADEEFSILQFNRIIQNYSDHNLLVSDFRIKDGQQ